MSAKVMPGGTWNGTLGLPGERRLHELGPDGQRRPAAAEAQRLVVVEAHPDDGQQLRREADEPGVAQVVGGAGLAGGVVDEAQPARAAAPVPSLSTLRIMLVTRKADCGLATGFELRRLRRHRRCRRPGCGAIARSGRTRPPLVNSV